MFENLMFKTLSGRNNAMPALKLGAAIAVQAGASPAAVAIVLGCNQETLNKWVRKLRKEGADALGAEVGRPRTLTDEIVNLVKDAVSRSPWERGYPRRHWNLPLLQRHLEESHAVHVTTGTLGRAMRRAGYRFQRATTKFTPAELQARRATHSTIRAVLDPSEGQTWFVDEAYFEVEGPGRGRWVPRSQPGPINFSRPRRGCLMFGALRHDGLFLMEERDASTSAAVINFLGLVMLHEAVPRPVRIVWDNARCHTARATREWIGRRPDWEVILLQPYCSELNPIEGVWDLLRRDCAATAMDPIALRTALRDRAAAWRVPNKELAAILHACAKSTNAGHLVTQKGRHSEASAQLLFGGDGDGKEG